MLACVAVAGWLMAFAGCEGRNPLAQQQDIDRARLPLEPLATQPAQDEIAPEGVPTSPSGLAIAPPRSEPQGIYSFTTPDSLTRVKRTTNDYEQYQLFFGRPAPTDLPFLTIRVGKNPEPEVTRQGSVLKANSERTYLHHGLITHEWSGYTADGRYPFVELIMQRPGAEDQDQLHALAVPRSNDMRTLALEVLGSIRWEER